MEKFNDPVMFSIFLIFFGASVLATFMLYARQSLLVAYVLLGLLCGPAVTGLISDATLISELSHVGIVFLLFLLGMNLPPQKLLHMLGSTLNLTLSSSVLLIGLGALIAFFAELHLSEALLAGAALLFSSTIIGLKLLPTTVLHHQRTGGTIISILLLQDMIAVIVLLLVQGGGASSVAVSLLALPLIGGLIYLLNRFVLLPLFRRFDVIQEYVFLVAIGWGLG
ncbi:MAG TPA: sodium:proton antiporter, partial [Zetaproteobacteria bacterium]|nr:sodium:proton antiporter [Zetaproteobacteria bacterium]